VSLWDALALFLFGVAAGLLSAVFAGLYVEWRRRRRS
jgi:hypothetical protein